MKNIKTQEIYSLIQELKEFKDISYDKLKVL